MSRNCFIMIMNNMDVAMPSAFKARYLHPFGTPDGYFKFDGMTFDS